MWAWIRWYAHGLRFIPRLVKDSFTRDDGEAFDQVEADINEYHQSRPDVGRVV